MLLNILHCKAESLKTKNYLASNINTIISEKCDIYTQIMAFCTTDGKLGVVHGFS